MIKIHPFEVAGLGIAPFDFLGVEEMAVRSGDGTNRAAGSCQYCSTGIRYAFWIKSSDGRQFYVGIDCLRKLGRSDNRLLSAAEKAQAQHEQILRAARKQADLEAKRQAREAAEQAERAANGGRTLLEIEEQRRRIEDARIRDQAREQYGWLLGVLREQESSVFCNDCADEIEKVGNHHQMSEKCIMILRDIFCKHHGRRGSKKYLEAEKIFNTRLDTNIIDTMIGLG